MINKLRNAKRFLCILMSLAIVCAFMPGIGMAANAKDHKNKSVIESKQIKADSIKSKSAKTKKFQKKDYNYDTGFNLEYSGYWSSGTEIDEYSVDEDYPPIFPEANDCLTVTTDENVTTDYYYDEEDCAFYDSDGSEMPYDWDISWDDEYDFTPGYYYCSFNILDSYGDILAWSQSIPVLVTENMESTVINGIIYRVLDGSNEACVWWTENHYLSGNISIPSSVKMRNGKTYPVTSVDEYAFTDCERLTGVSLPSTIKNIGEYAFCSTGIKEIKVPASVVTIGEKALGYKEEYSSYYGYEYVKVPGFIIDAKSGTMGAQYAVANGFTWVDREAEAAAKAAAAKAAAEKAAAEAAARKAAARKAAVEAAAKAAKAKIKAKAIKGKKVKLTWKSVKNVSGFEVYQAAKKKGKYKKVAAINKAKATKWTSKKLKKIKKGKKVFYKVRVFTKIEGKKIYGKWSNIAVAKIRK